MAELDYQKGQINYPTHWGALQQITRGKYLLRDYIRTAKPHQCSRDLQVIPEKRPNPHIPLHTQYTRDQSSSIQQLHYADWLLFWVERHRSINPFLEECQTTLVFGQKKCRRELNIFNETCKLFGLSWVSIW